MLLEASCSLLTNGSLIGSRPSLIRQCSARRKSPGQRKSTGRLKACYNPKVFMVPHHRSTLATAMSTLIDLVHEGQDILVDGRSQKIDRFAGRCAAWTEKVEGALQTDPLTLSRFRRAERSTITTGVPSNIVADWQITRGRVDALIQIAGEAATSKGGPWRFWMGLLVGFVFGAISTFVTAVVLSSDRIDAVRAAVHNLFNRA